MDTIQRHVNQVWRRLALRQFLFALGWSWFAALSLALVVAALARYRPLPTRDGVVLAVALAIGFVAAILISWRRIPRVHGAAWEIDRRFGLKDRVASTLAMNPIERNGDAGQAFVADADARLKKLNLDEKFTLAPARRVLLPLLPRVGFAGCPAARWPRRPSKPARSIRRRSRPRSKAVSVLRDRLSNERQKTDKTDLAANELLKEDRRWHERNPRATVAKRPW